MIARRTPVKPSRSASPAPRPADEGARFLRLLGERVREARARRGMTRRILARDSGVSERYLAQLESGQGNVSVLLLQQIAARSICRSPNCCARPTSSAVGARR